MSSKIGLILSSLFIVMAFLLGCDLITVQYMYADLDAKSVNISYLISRAPYINFSFINSISSQYQVEFFCQKIGTPSFGEEIYYTLSQSFKPLFMSSESMTVSIERMCIVGYYG